jgi:RNA polymerase sigma factor for flagellar operon FliA
MNGDHDPADSAQEAADLFRSNLPLIDRVIARVCRQAGVRDADADDFSSAVKVALIEDGYTILRSWQRRSSLATYLTVVIQRLLSDERMRARGRWEPSAAARRGGPAAVLLETIVRRDGQSIEHALPLVQAIDPALSRSDAESILAAVPERVPRPRPLPLNVADLSNVSAHDAADAPLMEKETERLSIETSRIVRSALASLPAEDRTIVRCHFGTGMSVADIARMLRLPQRPLYRRIESITGHLRRALIASGIDTGTAGSLIGSSVQALDFGLTSGKTELAPQSDQGGGPAESGAAR